MAHLVSEAVRWATLPRTLAEARLGGGKRANHQLKLVANRAGSTDTRIGLIVGGRRRSRLNQVDRLGRMSDWGFWEMSARHSAQWHNGGMT